MSYDFADLYPSIYLSAADLPDEGVTVTVKGIGKAAMRDGKQVATLSFVDVSKDCIWNVTKGNLMKQLYGAPSNWIGKKVMLRPGTTYFGKELVACVNAFPPKGTAAAAVAMQAPPHVTEPTGEPDQYAGLDD
jgi:hypothetical protein